MRRIYKIIIHGQSFTINHRTGQGLDELYKKVNPRLTAMARSYFVEGKDQEDKLQDLRIKLYYIIPSYNKSRAYFSTFMVNCLKNFIRNQIKYNKLRESVSNFESLTAESLTSASMELYQRQEEENATEQKANREKRKDLS